MNELMSKGFNVEGFLYRSKWC